MIHNTSLNRGNFQKVFGALGYSFESPVNCVLTAFLAKVNGVLPIFGWLGMRVYRR